MRLSVARKEQWTTITGVKIGDWIISNGRKGKIVKILQESATSTLVEVSTT